MDGKYRPINIPYSYLKLIAMEEVRNEKEGEAALTEVSTRGGLRMTRLSWFSGGDERNQVALSIIDRLLHGDSQKIENPAVMELLEAYYLELKQRTSAPPFILSRLNVDLSRQLSKEKIELSPEQSEALKELRKLSYIRYGY